MSDGGTVNGGRSRRWRILAGSAAAVLLLGAVLAGVLLTVVPKQPPVGASCTPQQIAQAVSAVSTDEIRATLDRLAPDEPAGDAAGDAAGEPVSRHVSSPGNAAAVADIGRILTAAGLSPREQPFRSDGRRLANVVATVTGTDRTVRYGVGAHLDSISDRGEVAPGADDNASGVAAVLEAARVVRLVASPCLHSSIDFVAFNDEEEGMKGSATYAADVRRSMRGFINVDMIGNGSEPCVIASYHHDRDVPIATAVADAARGNDLPLDVVEREYTEPDQDAASFWEERIPVSYVYECSPSPHYHSSTDRVEYLDIAQIAATTRTLVAALLALQAS